MIYILLGLIGLWIGTQYVIKAALGISDRFNLSHSFVGVAILAVGTDLPEVFVTLKASLLHLQGIESSGIIVGNALGSSISQITVILGIAGLLLNFNIKKQDLKRDGIALFSSIALLFIFSMDGVINRGEGCFLIAVYIAYYITLVRNHQKEDKKNSASAYVSISRLTIYLISGLSVLIFSSHLVVEHSMQLAEKWGVAQSFVGIAVIGLGTSLPELAVSVGAALRKSAGLSVGNIIGSNIFDGLIPIGLGGLVSTTNVESNIIKLDLPFLLIATLLVLLFLSSKRGISKAEGVALVLIYLIYISLKIFQQ